jgi:hypothetical protein
MKRRSPRNHPEPPEPTYPYRVYDINNKLIKEHDIVQFETNYHGLLGARGRVEHIQPKVVGVEVTRGNTYTNDRPYRETEYRKSTNLRIISYAGCQSVRNKDGLQSHEKRHEDRTIKCKAR